MLTDPIMRIRATFYVFVNAVRLKLRVRREGMVKALAVHKQPTVDKPVDKTLESPPVVLDVGACAVRVLAKTSRGGNDGQTFSDIPTSNVEEAGKCVTRIVARTKRANAVPSSARAVEARASEVLPSSVFVVQPQGSSTASEMSPSGEHASRMVSRTLDGGGRSARDSATSSFPSSKGMGACADQVMSRSRHRIPRLPSQAKTPKRQESPTRRPGQEPSGSEPDTPPDQQFLAFGSLGLQHLGTIGDGTCASRILSRTAAQGQQMQQPSNTDPSSGMGTWAKMMVDRTPAAESTQNATAEGTQSPQPKWKQLVEERIHRVRAQTAACDTDARRSSGPDGSSTQRSAWHDDGLENLHHPAGTSASSQPSLTATTRMEPPSPPASPPDFVASPPPRVGAPSASAAVTLQSAWRRSVSSRDFGAKKASARESQLAEWVATRMQAVVRRRNAKHSVVKLKSTVKLQSAYRKRAQQKELNTAVVVMQNAWRAKSVRKHKTEIRRNALIEKLERKAARDRPAPVPLLRRRQSAQDLMTKESTTMKDLFDFKAAELFECVVTGCRILR